MNAGLRIERGVVHVLQAYDIGLSIDLALAKRSITDLTELAQIKHKGHAPAYFQFEDAPLRVTQAAPPIRCRARATRGEVDLVVHDFGGVSVIYEIEFSGTLDELIEFSCELAGTDVFRVDSRERVGHLLSVIQPAVSRANIDPLTEDYLIFQLPALGGTAAPEQFLREHGAAIARLLRSEGDELSLQETGDVINTHISFGRRDLAVIDWNAAFLMDDEPADVLSVLEFANLQLLELRFLDQRLDVALDRSYEVVNADRRWVRFSMPGKARTELRRIAQLQVDAAILFERVNNALKLTGDQYLARLYRATSQRFRLAEWNTGILRKLETVEGIYDKLHDHATEIRMEVLEWIIIILIAIELVIPLAGKLGWG